jgi:hypothetical protein
MYTNGIFGGAGGYVMLPYPKMYTMAGVQGQEHPWTGVKREKRGF